MKAPGFERAVRAGRPRSESSPAKRRRHSPTRRPSSVSSRPVPIDLCMDADGGAGLLLDSLAIHARRRRGRRSSARPAPRAGPNRRARGVTRPETSPGSIHASPRATVGWIIVSCRPRPATPHRPSGCRPDEREAVRAGLGPPKPSSRTDDEHQLVLSERRSRAAPRAAS